MTGRVLMTIALLSAAVYATSCGDDDDEPQNTDEPQIASVSQNAVYAWIDAGAEGLTDYLSESAKVGCSEDGLQQSLDDYGTPGNWLETKDVTFEGTDDATATVVIDLDGEETSEEWAFVREGDSWRIASIEGVVPCRVPAV